MLFKKWTSRSESSPIESIELQIRKIQDGDIKLRNEFIANYQPFIAKTASAFTKKYIDPAKDDEFSIALAAFNEAISHFTHQSGNSFLNFAQSVIHRRLIDYHRKEQKFRSQIPYSSFETEEDASTTSKYIENQQSIRFYEDEQLVLARQSEIEQLIKALAVFKIQLSDLVELSPKHADSRSQLLSIGKFLSDHDEWMDILLQKKMLPIKEILPHVQVSRKTLERNRKFLIAVALIYYGAYPHLEEYLYIPS